MSLSYTKIRLSGCPGRLIGEYSGNNTYSPSVTGAMEYGKNIHTIFRNDEIVRNFFPSAKRITFEREIILPHKTGITLHGFIDCVVEDERGTHVLELKTGYIREYSQGQIDWYMSLLIKADNLDPMLVDCSFVTYDSARGFILLPTQGHVMDIDSVVNDYIQKMDMTDCIKIKRGVKDDPSG